MSASLSGPPSVVFLTTYPLVAPRHGGQLRSRALVEAYRAAGFTVQTLAVVEKGAFPRKALGDHDLEFPTDDPRWFLDGKATPITGDLRSGDFATSTEAYLRVLTSLPRTIDVFHLEQPWLLPLVLKLKSEPRYAAARLVYGSQNIEAALREAIYRQMGFAGGAAVIERVLAVETSACRLADLTLAVSPSDHTTLEKIGARRVLRAPNGISTWQANPRLVDRWNAKINARRIALFVGSAHPPNIDGFIRAFGDSLGFVPPDCRIVIAGGVGPHLRNHYHRARFDTLNLSRLEVTGELDDDDLAAIKNLTSVFLLPIFEGGGSNIKTAEAIHSGKPVIATSMSLRGFEAYTHLPEISVADDKERFRLAVRKALSPQPPIPPQPGEGALRAKLLWQECLAVVPPAVQKLLTR